MSRLGWSLRLAVVALLLSSFHPDRVTATDSAGYPLIKGSPADPGAQPGSWIGWEDLLALEEKASSPEVRGAWEPIVRGLATIIRESPALVNLGGYYPQIYASLDPKAEPVPRGRITLNAWWPYAVEPVSGASPGSSTHRVKPEYVYNRPGGLGLFLNWIPESPNGRSDGFTSTAWMNDSRGRFFLMPPGEREIAGYPVLGGYLFVAAAGAPPLFLPVSQERALEAQLAWLQEQGGTLDQNQADMQSVLAEFNSPEMKQYRRMAIEAAGEGETDPVRVAAARKEAERLDREQEEQLRQLSAGIPGQEDAFGALGAARHEIETRLAALSPREREAPAQARIVPGSVLDMELASAGDSGAIPLMMVNGEFFGRGLTQGAVRLLTIAVPSREDFEGKSVQPADQPLQIRVPIAVAEQTDWRRAAALLR